MPILPKQRDIYPGDLLDEPAGVRHGPGRLRAPFTHHVARWISEPDARMLGDDLRVNERIVDPERPLSPVARLESI